MNGQEKLYIIALIISSLVIIGLVIVFSFLFFLYSFYKVKHINIGSEDLSLTKEVKERTIRINKKRRKENKLFLNLKDSLLLEEKSNRLLHILMSIFSYIIIAFFLSIFSIGLVYKVNNDNLFINDVTYLTILTGSMESRDEKNEYLFEYDLTNQIEQYSLVGIEKIKQEEDIKLFDILAYKHEDIIILHRVIDIRYDEENEEYLYTLRGDANSLSLSYETSLKFEDFIGKYNNFSNYGLGIFITYIKSPIGIISLFSASIFLFLANIAECRINKAYKIRINKLIDNTLIIDKNEESYLSSLIEDTSYYDTYFISSPFIYLTNLNKGEEINDYNNEIITFNDEEENKNDD